MQTAVAQRTIDPRASSRSNVFLAASLQSDGKSLPARIRNISERGALVDAAGVPGEGSRIRLRRGSLAVVGEIAWKVGDQCGIRFETRVAVSDWVAKVGKAGQQRVDQMIELARGNATSGNVSVLSLHERDGIAEIGADLAAVCERLVDLPILVERSEEILELDAIVQRLARFANSESFGD